MKIVHNNNVSQATGKKTIYFTFQYFGFSKNSDYYCTQILRMTQSNLKKYITCGFC